MKARFDVAGLRVFRLLALRGQLEQKQVGASGRRGGGRRAGGPVCVPNAN